ncbi:unnamed protein product [Brachionus calyciflorus]|uniref:G-protein coupled receptors family 1 profile domain-containing protein n=1 Tax=Brachionus calyciflorus TaxID=104777 RepID=A0A813MDY1_9BILA|nr:unnamed protein product [Brachionus calyciflorus]
MNVTFFQNRTFIYNSTESLSLRITDIGNSFILPPICFIGIILNLINILVLLQPELKDEINKFMLINSILDLKFLLICSVTFIIRCGSFCQFGYTYISKFYELYIYLFVGNSILLFATLMEILVSLNRLFSFSTSPNLIFKKFNKLNAMLKCVILIIFSLFINFPSYILTRSVQRIGILETKSKTGLVNYKELYIVGNNRLGKDPLFTILLFLLTLFRGIFFLAILFILNIIIGYKFRLQMHKKTKILPDGLSILNSKSIIKTKVAEEKVTKMIMLMCMLYLFGNVPNSISPILFTLKYEILAYNKYVIFGNVMLFASRGSYFFVYLYFNKNFKNALIRIIQKILMVNRTITKFESEIDTKNSTQMAK